MFSSNARETPRPPRVNRRISHEPPSTRPRRLVRESTVVHTSAFLSTSLSVRRLVRRFVFSTVSSLRRSSAACVAPPVWTCAVRRRPNWRPRSFRRTPVACRSRRSWSFGLPGRRRPTLGSWSRSTTTPLKFRNKSRVRCERRGWGGEESHKQGSTLRTIRSQMCRPGN